MRPSESERLTKRRKIIDLIRSQPQKYGEISKKTDIPGATVARILKELKSLGLVKKVHTKKGIYWTWCRDTKPWQGNLVLLDSAVNHAQKLIPGFLALAEDYPQGRYQTTDDKKYVSPEQAEGLKEFAESHLKTAPSYQHIYKNLLEFRRLKSKFAELYTERVEKMMRALRGKILTPDRFQILESKKKPSTSWFRKLFPEVDYVKRDIPYVLGPFETREDIIKLLGVPLLKHKGFFQLHQTKKWYFCGPIELGANSESMKKFDEFIQTKEEKIIVQANLTRQIWILKLQIEHGQPLDKDSHCKICTNIIIKEEDSKKP